LIPGAGSVRVAFFLALPIEGGITIQKPIQKLHCLGVREILCQFNDSSDIKRVGQTLFTVYGCKFETVSGTHEFVAFRF